MIRDGIFVGAVRTFVMALFAIVGIGFGFLVFMAVIGAISSSTGSKEIETHYTLEILPNADGVRKEISKKAPVILQINIDGVIGTETLNTSTIRQQLVESREGDLKKDRVKAILLNINTPGGTVVDSDNIYRALNAYKEQYKVPIYAYVDGMCASGGMMAACAADKIYANNVSLIGSVGVIAGWYMNFSKVLSKYDIQTLSFSEGKGKDELNPIRPWGPNEGDTLQAIMHYYYDMFVTIVNTARPAIGKDKLVKDYGAKVFPAPQAKEYGFIDESGISREATLKLLLTEIGIEDDYYQVVQMHSQDWLSKIFTSKNTLWQGKITHTLDLSEDYNPALSGKLLYLYRP